MTITEEQRGTVGFDLEKARDLAANPIHCPETDEVFRKAMAEIERLQEFRDRVARILKLPLTDCDDLLLLGLGARVCQLREQAARVQELEAELAEMHNCALEVAGFLAEKENLEAALVEERANKMIQADDCTQNQDAADFHHRCICEYNVKKCPIEQWWLDRARITLQAEGKIGPDARPPCWQITEDRVTAIDQGLRFLEWSNAKTGNVETKKRIAILKTMLEEAGDEHGFER